MLLGSGSTGRSRAASAVGTYAMELGGLEATANANNATGRTDTPLDAFSVATVQVVPNFGSERPWLPTIR